MAYCSASLDRPVLLSCPRASAFALAALQICLCPRRIQGCAPRSQSRLALDSLVSLAKLSGAFQGRPWYVVVRFVAYIDESGDTGLENVKPNDTGYGATEWLILSCFLIREQDDHKCLGWVREIKSKFKISNSPFLHYKELNQLKRKIACETINEKACRFFVVASNKKNIEDHRNERAELVSGKGTHWLYWFLCRLLLERVTCYCEERVPPAERGRWKILFVFSRRGGLIYRDFRNYLLRLHRQSRLGKLHLHQGDLCWSVVDEDELLVLDSNQRAGLQLSDLCSSAFFQALELKPNFSTDCAKLFAPRLARDKRGHVLNCGIKTMPELRDMGLSKEQREIFEFYGYSPREW